jgi:hypothetical protein
MTKYTFLYNLLPHDIVQRIYDYDSEAKDNHKEIITRLNRDNNYAKVLYQLILQRKAYEEDPYYEKDTDYFIIVSALPFLIMSDVRRGVAFIQNVILGISYEKPEIYEEDYNLPHIYTYYNEIQHKYLISTK